MHEYITYQPLKIAKLLKQTGTSYPCTAFYNLEKEKPIISTILFFQSKNLRDTNTIFLLPVQKHHLTTHQNSSNLNYLKLDLQNNSVLHCNLHYQPDAN